MPEANSPDHYFTAQPASDAERRPLRVRLAGAERELETASGLFSPDHIDDGTQVLLDSAPPPDAHGTLLDIGCGWGALALTMALEAPESTVWAVDVNTRALDVVERNSVHLGIENVRAVLPGQVPDDIQFDTIWSNPPIRIGKDALHELLRHWLPRLKPGGDAWLVVQKNLGADSLHRWLETEFPSATIERAAVGKGYRVLRFRTSS